MLRSVVLASIVLGCVHLNAGAARAETPQQVLAGYAAQAHAKDPSFAGFFAERGEAFYVEPHLVKGAGHGELRVVPFGGRVLLGARA